MKQTQYIKEIKSKVPVIVLDLKEYEALIEYVEDIEDRLAIRERAELPEYDFKKLVKKLDKKHRINRLIK